MVIISDPTRSCHHHADCANCRPPRYFGVHNIILPSLLLSETPYTTPASRPVLRTMLALGARSALSSGQSLMSSIRLTRQNTVLEAASSRSAAKLQAALLHPLCSSVQQRLQSTMPESKRPEPSRQQQKQQQKQQQQPLTKEEILHILRKGLDLRPFFKAIGTKEGFKKLYRQSPEELIVAIALYVLSQPTTL